MNFRGGIGHFIPDAEGGALVCQSAQHLNHALSGCQHGGDGEQADGEKDAIIHRGRAKEKLVLTGASRRMLHGSTVYNPPSRFLGEIPEHLKEVECEDASSSFYGYGGFSAGSSYHSARYGGRGNGHREPVVPSPNRNQSGQTVAFAGSTLFSSSSGAKKTTPTPDFACGDAVKHKKFGEGVILKAEKMGNDMLLEVAFSDYGTKKLMANSAKLEKL